MQNRGDLLEKYIDAFKTEDEAVLDDLKRKFYYNTPMFDAKEINPYELAREGRQQGSAALHIGQNTKGIRKEVDPQCGQSPKESLTCSCLQKKKGKRRHLCRPRNRRHLHSRADMRAY